MPVNEKVRLRLLSWCRRVAGRVYSDWRCCRGGFGDPGLEGLRRPGDRELDVAATIHYELIRSGAESVPFLLLASGARSCHIHPTPGPARLEPGRKLQSRAHPSLRTRVGDPIFIRIDPEKCVALKGERE